MWANSAETLLKKPKVPLHPKHAHRHAAKCPPRGTQAGSTSHRSETQRSTDTPVCRCTQLMESSALCRINPPTLRNNKTGPRQNIRIKSAILSNVGVQNPPYYFNYPKLSLQTQRQRRGAWKLLTPGRNLLELHENITAICPFLFFITHTARRGKSQTCPHCNLAYSISQLGLHEA